MTVPSVNVTSGPYVGNGVTVDFDYDFPIQVEEDLLVYKTSVSTGVATELVLTTDYTVSGVGDDTGGQITLLGTPITSDYEIFILSNREYTQLTDFASQGGFFPDVHEKTFDNLAILIQQLKDFVDRRSFSFDESAVRSVLQNRLPDPQPGYFMQWDIGGGLVNTQIGSVLSGITLSNVVEKYNSMSAVLAASPASSIIYVASYFAGWESTTTDAKGGHFRKRTGGTNSAPTRGTAVAVSTIGTGTQSGLMWDASGVEWELYSDKICPNMFGARSDGSTDDFTAIQDADTFATLKGFSVHFTTGTFAVDQQNDTYLEVTTNWYGNGATIKNTNLAVSSDTPLVHIHNQDGILIDGLHLDGQITTAGSGTPNLDQAVPSDANINDYTTTGGYWIQASNKVTIQNCNVTNVFRAGFRADNGSTDIAIINCSSERNRGTFGDPIYIQYCRNVIISKCRVKDYTRIGIVIEGVAGLTQASDYTRISDCYAEYAHDNISSENNVGFWCENAAQVEFLNCQAVNTVGGFVVSSTTSAGAAIANSGVKSPLNTYNTTNCTATSVKTGFVIDAGDDAVFNFDNCHSYSPASVPNGTLDGSSSFGGFYAKISANIKLSVNISNCMAYIDNAAYATTESYGFLGIQQLADYTADMVFNVVNCQLGFTDADKVRTDAASGNGKGFYFCIGNVGVTANLTNIQEIDATDDTVSMSVTSYDDKHKLFVNNSRPQIIKGSGRSDCVVLTDCEYIDCDVNMQVNDVNIKGSGFNLLSFTTNNWKMSDCVGVQVNQTSVDPHSRYDIFTAKNCNFNGNLGSASTCYHSIIDSREARAYYFGCVFHNSAGATNTYEFVEFDSGFGYVAGTGNLIDNRITNIINQNGSMTTNPKTATDVDVPFGLLVTIDA